MNNRFLIFIACILIAPVRIACQNVPGDNGYTKIFHPNGKISSEGMMRNGLPDGYWKTYYPSGIIKSEGNRRNHMLDSTWVFYNEMGDTLQKVNYIMGKRNGYVTEYRYKELKDPLHLGKIVSRELYVNDKKAGKSFYYYENGDLKETVEFKDNKRHGTAVEYDNKGGIITFEQYLNGVLVNREKINRLDAQGLKQGIWRTFYENGRVKSEASYRNDLMNGPYKEYEENGLLKVFLQYDKGVLQEKTDTAELDVEVRNMYDDSGSLIYSGTYRKDVPVGIHRSYNKEGKVVNAVLYSDGGYKLGEGIITAEGRKEEKWTNYFENGIVKSSGNFTNNLENGTWQFFFNNGKKEQSGIYKNGKFSGNWQWYYPNGNIKREEEYFEGREEGSSVEYDTVGNVIVKGSYFDGLKEGEWYYQAGDFSEIGKYVGDLKDGKWKAFYANGKLAYEGNYIQGNPDGEHIYYYNNGKIKEIAYYVMGIAEKNWRKYDENGNLLITISYKDNKEYRINGQKIDFQEDDVKLIQ